MIKLDDRLLCVCKYVIGDTVCDIGCDHGKLCAYLLQQGIVKKAYGVDISEASLDKSRELKEKLRLDNFELVVGDGFSQVEDKVIHTGIICGIGSNETIGIINRDADFAARLKRLVLCPLKNTYLVREFLFNSGFAMIDEDMVYENGRYYNVFIAQQGREKQIDDINIFVGRRLIEKGHPYIIPWLEKRICQVESSITAYDENAVSKRDDKRMHLVRMYTGYRKGLELC